MDAVPTVEVWVELKTQEFPARNAGGYPRNRPDVPDRISEIDWRRRIGVTNISACIDSSGLGRGRLLRTMAEI